MGGIMNLLRRLITFVYICVSCGCTLLSFGAIYYIVCSFWLGDPLMPLLVDTAIWSLTAVPIAFIAAILFCSVRLMLSDEQRQKSGEKYTNIRGRLVASLLDMIEVLILGAMYLYVCYFGLDYRPWRILINGVIVGLMAVMCSFITAIMYAGKHEG